MPDHQHQLHGELLAERADCAGTDKILVAQLALSSPRTPTPPPTSTSPSALPLCTARYTSCMAIAQAGADVGGRVAHEIKRLASSVDARGDKSLFATTTPSPPAAPVVVVGVYQSSNDTTVESVAGVIGLARSVFVEWTTQPSASANTSATTLLSTLSLSSLLMYDSLQCRYCVV